ncbi:isoleucyl-tRNA synthetase [Edaphobacter lichenicola]|uniref:Isoleucine--tRNA ligase n=3 Tax=Tunturiibacter empetritectus TaxID=3069691 RepID=A0A7W8IGN9_9BACT|nr:isoleucyl-tRNA synthetase [Edaphobacter lichenicola]
MSEATQAKPELKALKSTLNLPIGGKDNASDPAPKALKSTLNLPQTTFPMKANLPQNEPARLQAWQQGDLYGQIRTARAGQPKYILHDGPPYANGAIHLGHALNKCIKDFVVKTKTMAGFDAPYVPGWDCHGLPIEIKVDEQLGRKKLEMDPIAVRRACREYAQKYVDLQRSQFERIGVFGRWNDPYLTMSFGYEASIVETFYDFFEKKFVYKGLKPVYWCIHDRTALAEAEVEYDQHTSPSVYVRYKLTSDPAVINAALAGKDVYTIIWTTTPWTLPASQAVAFNPHLEYVALACEGGTYLIAQALMSSVIAHCHLMSAKNATEPASQADILAVFTGNHLEHATFQHPFLDRSILGVTADYVTAEQGTGAVHTSPAHGVDDFYTGQRYKLPEIQYVDNAGRQRHTGTNGGGGVAQPYEDLTVFKSNPVIIELLKEKGTLLSDTTFEHSYPHCWRCHNPVIVRATEQWFIGMETPMITDEGTVTTFRQRALDEIKQVVWDPAWGEERISNMIATRPDWCISRQRIWGVPIAVFLCDKCGEPLNEPSINKSIVDLFKKEGADAWYKHEPAALLPAGTACAGCGHKEFRKEMDILDVWFESGSSWHAVLDLEPELHSPADLYTEGGDQHRGWFHSSLLTSVAVRNHAPYKMVATSGWTLDEQGRAFSKSLGNGVDPVDIAKRLGGEIIRLWVASVDFREDVAASENLMQRVSDNYRKLRNTLRFLLGNIHDFNPATDAIAFANLQPLDQYILARTAELDAKIRAAYDSFEFHRAYHALNEYVNTDLSALYLDVLKDRLYTFAPNHPGRRSAQTALWRIAETLTRLIAPILSFTADEVWALLPKVENRESSVHLAHFPAMSEIIPVTTRKLEEDFDHLLTLRDEVLKVLEEERTAKTISNKPSETQIVLGWLNTLAEQPNPVFEQYKSILPELFGVAQVEISNAIITEGTVEKGAFYVQAKPAAGSKCERCWRFTEDVGHEANYPTVCLRCAEALEAIHFPPYDAPPSNTTESQA